MIKYVWCEDKGSGYEFWRRFFKIYSPDVVIESKGNNTELRHAVTRITNSEDLYYIVVDHAVDNPDVLRELRKIYSEMQKKKNIRILKIHSFEFVLLSFEFLDQWIFSEVDELKEKRKSLLKAKDLFVIMVLSGSEAESVSELRNLLGYIKQYNTEQISSKLLFEITRNTGFETDKGHFGECFYIDCCEWEKRKSEDICGLDGKRLDTAQKMYQIMEHSVLKKAIEGAGL